MQEDFDMKDVVLDNGNNKKDTNFKKILIAIAILIVLFLIILIVMKFINSNNTEVSNTLSIPEKEEVVQTNNAINQLDANISSSASINNNVTTEDANNSNTISQPANISIDNEQNSTPITVTDNSKNMQVVDIKNEEEKAKVEKNIPAKAKNVNTTTNQQSKQKAIVKPSKEVKKIVSASSSLAKGAYVQVLATSSATFNQNHPLIQKIKEHNYKYSIWKTSVNNKPMTKILIGPYSEKEVYSHLKEIKSNISNGSFVFRNK